MSIKSKLKTKFNKEDNYNKITKKLENKSIPILKYSLVPLCLIVIFAGFLIFKNSDSKILVKDTEIKINNLNELFTETSDYDGHLVMIDIANLEQNYQNLIQFDKVMELYNTLGAKKFYQNLKIPEELKYISTSLTYTRSIGSDGYAVKEYDTLHQYNIVYQINAAENIEIEKQIIISIAKDFIPLPRYCMQPDEENFEKSRIKDTSLAILNYDNIYMTKFNYHKLNFDIETRGLTETEVIKLLESIIK